MKISFNRKTLAPRWGMPPDRSVPDLQPQNVKARNVTAMTDPDLGGYLRRFFGTSGRSASIRPYHRVYLIGLPGENGSPDFWILKPLRIGAGRAACIGRLLSRGAKYGFIPELFRRGADPEQPQPYHWYRGNRYLITSFLPGRPAEYHDLHDLQAALQTMRSFHGMTTGLLQEDPEHWEILRYDPIREWRARLEEFNKCKQLAIKLDDGWSRRYLNVWGGFYRQAQAALEELYKFRGDEATPQTLCYHDWAHHNVLIASGTARLIDFDELLLDHPAHDRANLIGRYLRLGNWSIPSLHRILRENHRHYPWRCGEIRLVRIYLTFPYDYWILGRQYFIEQQPWSYRYYDDQWQRKIAPDNLRLKLLEKMARME